MTNDRHLPETTGGIVFPLFSPRINSLLSYISRNSLLANINALACMNFTSVGENSFGKSNFTLASAKASQMKCNENEGTGWLHGAHRKAAQAKPPCADAVSVSNNKGPGAGAAMPPACCGGAAPCELGVPTLQVPLGDGR